MWGLFVFLVEQLELCEPEPQVGRMGGGRWKVDGNESDWDESGV